jgi:hypothetical protein
MTITKKIQKERNKALSKQIKKRDIALKSINALLRKYGCIEELQRRCSIYRETGDARCKQTLLDRKKYHFHRRKLEALSSVSMLVNSRQPPTQPPPQAPLESSNSSENQQSPSTSTTQQQEIPQCTINNERNNESDSGGSDSENESRICNEDEFELGCSNCRRRQSHHLLREYGDDSIYNIQFERYVIKILFFKNTQMNISSPSISILLGT